MRTVQRSILTGVLMPVSEAVGLGVRVRRTATGGDDMNDLLQGAIRAGQRLGGAR